MFYINPESKFSFQYSPFECYVGERSYLEGTLVKLIYRIWPGVSISIKANRRKNLSTGIQEYFKNDIPSLQRSYDRLKVTKEEKIDFKTFAGHRVYFETEYSSALTTTILSKEFLYTLTFTTLKNQFNHYERFFQNFLENFQIESHVPVFIDGGFNFFASLYYFNGGNTVANFCGDICIKASKNSGLMIQCLELQCIDKNKKIVKNVFYDVSQIQVYGRIITSGNIFYFSNIVCPNDILVLLLPNIRLPKPIQEVLVNLYGRYEKGNKFKKEYRILPTVSFTAKYSFPLKGKWRVNNGPGFYSIHRQAFLYYKGILFNPQRFALDLVQVDEKLSTFRGEGMVNEDYYAFGKSVFAPYGGKVVDVVQNIPDNVPQVQNLEHPLGNYVIIQHDLSEYSMLCHLKHNSILVRKEEALSAGQLIGLVGNSGNSSESHLHFQISNSPEIKYSQGSPIVFKGIGFLQDGDIVECF